MPSYIEAGELLMELNDTDIFDTYNDYSMVFDTIDNFPTADVAPVRHGRFRRLTFSGDTIICSECKMAYNIFETNGAENFNFCPHCGAKMDGKDGEENG